MLALVAALRPIVSKISELTCEIAHRVRAHPDGHVFLSLFKDPKSVVCAAALLAEIGDCRARYRTAEALAADAGMSPVAVESGKRKVATFRWGCDHRLRAATCTLADATHHWHPWAADPLRRRQSPRPRPPTRRSDGFGWPRRDGGNSKRAIRTLGRAWIRVLWRCWQDNVAYDPAKHRGLQDHIAVTIPDGSSPRLDPKATQRMAGAAGHPQGGAQRRARSA